MIFGVDITNPLGGPFLAACAVLAIAGVAKVLHPMPAQVAARAAGLRVPRMGVVVFGLIEVVVATTGAVLGGPSALGVAAAYLFLTFVAVRLLRRSPATPCACLGSSSAVVTRTHVVVDVVATGVAFGAAAGGSPWARLPGHWLAAAVFVVLVLTCVKLVTLVLETLPVLADAVSDGATGEGAA